MVDSQRAYVCRICARGIAFALNSSEEAVRHGLIMAVGGFAEEDEFMEIICKDCHSVLCWQRVAARLGLSLLSSSA
jgi:hypothetical protein